MKILVTGAAGFIGSNLCELMLLRGNKVVGIDNFDPFYPRVTKNQNLKSITPNKNFLLYEGDIRNSSFLNTVMKEVCPDVVVHLAAKAGVRPSIMQPAEYVDVNINGTLNVLEVMRENNISNLVFASSSSVYGNNKKVPFSESDSVDKPISPYAFTKRAGEILCYNYHHLYNFNIFALRFFTVYGRRQRPEMAIHYFTRAIYESEPINVFGDGATKRDYTYIDDILIGIENAIKSLQGFSIINLGESKTISLIDLIQLIEKKLNKQAIINWLPSQAGDVDITFADISKANEIINYYPSTDINMGIELFVQWFLEHRK